MTTETITPPVTAADAPPVPRVVERMPFHEYLAAEGVSQSALKTIGAKSLAHYRHERDHPRKVTRAMDVGTVAHMVLLEPETLRTRVVVSPYDEFRTKESKEWRAKQQARSLVVLKREEMDAVDNMVTAAREHRLYPKIFGSAGGMREVSVFVRCSVTGLVRKARFDRVPRGNALVDIKTTVDASQEGFGKIAWNLGYYRQAAWYLDCWNAAMPDDPREAFGFFCIESEAPHVTAFWNCPPDLIEVGRRENLADLHRLAYAMKTDSWPGYDDATDAFFVVPPWAARVVDQTLNPKG